jgi:hypothetical protein
MISTTSSTVHLKVRVQPRASRTRVVGPHGDGLKVQITAPPVDGAANQGVVDLLAEWLDVPRRDVRITQGQSARDKLVEVACADPGALAGRIAGLLKECVDKAGTRD